MATETCHLRRHQQSQDEGVSYSYNLCQYKATDKGHLRTHQQSKHEGKIYSCNECEYHTMFSLLETNLKIITELVFLDILPKNNNKFNFFSKIDNFHLMF